jgi:uncharacterized repeat protein (TIGR01451 family)
LSLGQPLDSPTSDEQCGPVLASCDPNDKTAIPTGITADNIIRANQPLDYKIRFQNTGNDTAFKVVIVDTLSNLLNAQTLEAGASSHPYRLEIYPGNILHFVFDPIALPDSNVNEVESHGFVNFRIQQQPDLPDGTVIENQVAIYFDKNEPVFTNIAFHTIGYPFIPNPPLVVTSVQHNPSCAGLANGEIEVAVNGGIPPYNYQWSDPNLQGNSLADLPPGTYQVTITDSYRGEWINSFTLVAPAALDVTLSATPASNNASDGTASVTASGGTGQYVYLWNTGATTANIGNLEAGEYTVTATDNNGCTQIGTVFVDELVATGEPFLSANIKVWPNPAHDKLTIELKQALPELLSMDILAADGRVLQRFQASQLQPVMQLELGKDTPSGLLLIVFHARNGSVATEKVFRTQVERK